MGSTFEEVLPGLWQVVIELRGDRHEGKLELSLGFELRCCCFGTFLETECSLLPVYLGARTH